MATKTIKRGNYDVDANWRYAFNPLAGTSGSPTGGGNAPLLAFNPNDPSQRFLTDNDNGLQEFLSQGRRGEVYSDELSNFFKPEEIGSFNNQLVASGQATNMFQGKTLQQIAEDQRRIALEQQIAGGQTTVQAATQAINDPAQVAKLPEITNEQIYGPKTTPKSGVSAFSPERQAQQAEIQRMKQGVSKAGLLPTQTSKGVTYNDIVASQGGQGGNVDREANAARAQSLAPVLKPGQSSGGTSMNLAQPNYGGTIAQADAQVAGAKAGASGLQGYLDKLATPDTALDKQNQAYLNRLNELYGQDVGKAEALSKEEKKAGVDEKTKQLQSITNQINIKNAEYEKLSTQLQGQAIPMSAIIGQQSQVRLQQASEIGLLSARAQALQGDITLAKETAARAVDLQYSRIEEEIAAKERQLQLIQSQLDKEQQKIAHAQQMMLDDQKQVIADQKAIQNLNLSYSLDNNVGEAFFYRGNQIIRTADGMPLYENVGGEIRRLSDNKRYGSSAEFFADSGINNWNQIHANTAVAEKFETVTLGSGKSARKVRYGYDSKGNIVSAVDLATGQSLSLDGTTPSVVRTPGVQPRGPGPAPAPKKITVAEGTNLTDAYIQPRRGADGFISPEDWSAAKAAWIADGLDVNTFISRFKKYINPADPQDYK